MLKDKNFHFTKEKGRGVSLNLSSFFLDPKRYFVFSMGAGPRPGWRGFPYMGNELSVAITAILHLGPIYFLNMAIIM